MNKSNTLLIVAVALALVAALGMAAMAGVGAFWLFGGLRGSGNIVTESRSVDSFDRVSICCGMQLLLTQGDTAPVRLEGDDNILQRIETRVSGDKLEVEYAPMSGNVRPSRRIRVFVTIPEIQEVDVSGGGSLEANAMAVEELKLDISGGSAASIVSLTGSSFVHEASGGSTTDIGAGRVESQVIGVSGGGTYMAPDLESRRAQLDVSGGSRATIWVHDELILDASGGSAVRYYGIPSIQQDTSGGSSVESLGMHN